MKAGEALVVFTVDPFLFPFRGESVGLLFDLPVVLFEEVSDDFMVIIVGSNMKDS